MKKFAILSHVLPPSPSGQSVMLYRILSRLASSDYYLIASQPQQSSDDLFRLPGRIYALPPEPVLRFGIPRITSVLNLFIGIFARTHNLLAVLRHEPAGAIVACTGNLMDIPAAFMASRFAHIPFYAYIFDDYVYQWLGNYRRFARIIAPFIFKRTKGIIAPNEFICEEYRQRYGITPKLVRNPCDADELDREPCAPWPFENDKIKILYAGAVYHANDNCFRNLLTAMDSLTEYPLELHIFAAQTREQLLAYGIAGEKVIIHSHLPYRDILEQQCKADILFLPLAFDSLIPEVIRTSSPGKLGEYLASGRPILAHIPADSFVADYCGRYDCAGVVSQNDPAILAYEIRRIITDENFRTALIRNALSRARADFDPQHASEKLIQLLAR